MWPPRLRRQAATRTLKLLPTFLQVARGTCCTYSVTCLFKASSVLGLALYTLSFTAPRSQKLRGFKSGLWGAHSTSLFSAINLPGNSSFRYLIVPWAVWGGAPSCWYQAWRNWWWDKIPRKSLWKLLTTSRYRSALIVAVFLHDVKYGICTYFDVFVSIAVGAVIMHMSTWFFNP